MDKQINYANFITNPAKFVCLGFEQHRTEYIEEYHRPLGVVSVPSQVELKSLVSYFFGRFTLFGREFGATTQTKNI